MNIKNEDDLEDNIDKLLEEHGLTGMMCCLYDKDDNSASIVRNVSSHQVAFGIASFQAWQTRRINKNRSETSPSDFLRKMMKDISKDQ